MSSPKTLLEMSGASLIPSALSQSVIISIDCQNEYVNGGIALPDITPALEEAARVLAAGRKAGTPILHIAHRGRAGGAFDPDGPRGQIVDLVRPEGDEAVIWKPLPNAFANTDLHQALQKIGRKELILIGFQTHMCVSSTARAALDLGYRCTIVDKASGTRDLPIPGGGVISAPDLHRASLAALADRFAIIAPTAADLPV
ncbi:MAG: cysteine hydrolase [Alphaproteobacteria bacterium]|nr:cysteine hydrolase [Alphaproteobacteria bacterium]MBU0799017.1 cysteine hydrolase [Alphaproteobacteria bacterium]MBU0889247.1 cysteine hydrolase [Alphaproteobacteria bacterium]MBU1815063.1 cysteine hydrolase [Alphaproteobacteria bacterium]MBU2089435.1 cysteine hydrolase [Alphaproteobacteria bacterium]